MHVVLTDVSQMFQIENNNSTQKKEKKNKYHFTKIYLFLSPETHKKKHLGIWPKIIRLLLLDIQILLNVECFICQFE